MATYIIETPQGMTYAVATDRAPFQEVSGVVFRDYGGEVIALAPHGCVVIRQDNVAQPTVDEIEAAEQRGFERGRGMGPYRGERVGTLAGATVPAADSDLESGVGNHRTYEDEPGEGPIQPAPPLSAYEDPGIPAAHEDEYR